MEKYKILCELNRKEQFGEEITEEEKTAAKIMWNMGLNKETIRTVTRLSDEEIENILM